MKTTAIVPAGGQGTRFAAARGKKQFVSFHAAPLYVHTLWALERSPAIDNLILVVPKDDYREVVATLPSHGVKKLSQVVQGGKERQDSVWAGIRACAPDVGLILIHDAVRPLVPQALLDETIRAASQVGAAIAALLVTDTVKLCRNPGRVTCTLPREELYLAQTPQAFQRELIVNAYRAAYRDGYYGTDDANLVERIGGEVAIVMGSPRNIKVTTQDDLQLLEFYVTRDEHGESGDRLR